MNTCEKGGRGEGPYWYRPGTSLTLQELWQLRVQQAHAMENEQCYGRKTSLCRFRSSLSPYFYESETLYIVIPLSNLG